MILDAYISAETRIGAACLKVAAWLLKHGWARFNQHGACLRQVIPNHVGLYL